MTRFFVSDLHFSHRNIISFCDRPYKDVTDMNEAMVAEWNSKVKPEDEVYVLGDFSLNPKTAALYTPQLNGIKHLIEGNHDSCFEFDKKPEKEANQKQKYFDMGWESVSRFNSLVLSNGTEILMSHFPYRDPVCEQYDTRYLEYRPINNGTILLHGHQHARYVKHKNMIDVGWDNKLTLYTENEIIDLINDQREFIPSRLTDYYKEQGLSQREQKVQDIKK